VLELEFRRKKRSTVLRARKVKNFFRTSVLLEGLCLGEGSLEIRLTFSRLL
jgi:hypothetical protein